MQIIAHRGASGLAPENTLKAMSLALDLGAKAIELDVPVIGEVRQQQVMYAYPQDRQRQP